VHSAQSRRSTPTQFPKLSCLIRDYQVKVLTSPAINRKNGHKIRYWKPYHMYCQHQCYALFSFGENRYCLSHSFISPVVIVVHSWYREIHWRGYSTLALSLSQQSHLATPLLVMASLKSAQHLNSEHVRNLNDINSQLLEVRRKRRLLGGKLFFAIETASGSIQVF
jgi:hypothetical protein